MRIILPTFAKLNLTLRVMNKRPDGYHNLVSTFFKIPSGDVLYISESTAGIDVVNSNIIIHGENIVAKALKIARQESIPPGSGLGAGSGNAAAVLQLFGAEKVAAKVGADVPFLCSNNKIAIVSGIGEHVEKIAADYNLEGVIAIPDWQTETKSAYEELDAMGYSFDLLFARTEMRDIYHANAGKKVGLLPNDFLKILIKKHPKYNELFKLFESAGADAWGITGSGSAAFALIKGSVKLSWPGYVKHVLYF